MTINKQALRECFEKWWEINYHNGKPPRFGWEYWRDGEGYQIDDDESELDGMWESWQAAHSEKLEAAEKRVSEVRGYNVDLAEESRQYQHKIAELNNALCELLPGTQYMDPPDGGSVTPLEQVRRMVADYRQRIAELEAREVVLPAAWWVKQGSQSLLAYEKGMLLDALTAAGIITKVGE